MRWKHVTFELVRGMGEGHGVLGSEGEHEALMLSREIVMSSEVETSPCEARPPQADTDTNLVRTVLPINDSVEWR
jgi:hypothetical protein